MSTATPSQVHGLACHVLNGISQLNGLLGLTSRRGGVDVAATATLTMTQLSKANRIYQRSTTTGGGQGKGTGTVPVTINATATGTVYARCRSAADGMTILQGPFACTEISATGAQTMNVAGVDARYGWFYIDILDSAGWQSGTTAVGMGRLVGSAGQSLMARMVGRQDGDTATYASLGVTIDPNTSVFATYSETNSYMPTVATMPWQLPGDVGNSNGPNSVGCGEFLRRQAALFGVNCGLIGHSVGGSRLGSWLSGANYTNLVSVLSNAGGAFEAFIWGQGHSDASFGNPANGYITGLDLLWANITAANSFAAMKKYIWTVPTIASATWGTPYERNELRRGARAWCVTNSSVYVDMQDFAQGDGIHQSQAGSITMAQHMHRASQVEIAGVGNEGPSLISATRAGTTITATFSDVGQTNLVLTGAPANRFVAFSSGRRDNFASKGANAFPVSSVAVASATTLTLTLANDPGDGHALDLFVYWPNDPSNATTDNIRDDRTDGDGLTTGRAVKPNATAVAVAAPTPGGATNAPPGGYVTLPSPFQMVGTSTTFAAGASGFGNEMTGGTGNAAGGSTPYFSPFTIEGFFTCPAVPASTLVFFGGIGSDFIGINSTGKASTGSLTGSVTMVAGKRYHLAYQRGPSGSAIYLTNITDAAAGARVAYSATPMAAAPAPGTFGLRNHLGSFALSGGAVDEWAVFQSERYSGTTYTCPTAPFVGTESNIVALYHLDESTAATTLVESIAA